MQCRCGPLPAPARPLAVPRALVGRARPRRSSCPVRRRKVPPALLLPTLPPPLIRPNNLCYSLLHPSFSLCVRGCAASLIARGIHPLFHLPLADAPPTRFAVGWMKRIPSCGTSSGGSTHTYPRPGPPPLRKWTGSALRRASPAARRTNASHGGEEGTSRTSARGNGAGGAARLRPCFRSLAPHPPLSLLCLCLCLALRCRRGRSGAKRSEKRRAWPPPLQVGGRRRHAAAGGGGPRGESVEARGAGRGAHPAALSATASTGPCAPAPSPPGVLIGRRL